MDLNEFFGDNPQRPSHPDFWKLADVLLRLDSGLDPVNKTREENDAAYQARLADIGVDERSLSYAATQRAFRALGINTRQDLLAKFEMVAMLSSVWVDAFAAGVYYERKD